MPHRLIGLHIKARYATIKQKTNQKIQKQVNLKITNNKHLKTNRSIKDSASATSGLKIILDAFITF